MKNLLSFTYLIVWMIAASNALFAQSLPIGTDAADQRNQKTAAALSNLAPANRTSPFDPPEDNDHRFSVDSGSGLDTGCTFRSGGPLIFNLEIKRFIGELNSDGTLKNADALIASGALSSTVKLIMPAFDVDSNANFPGVAPERNLVSINGNSLGFLTGENNQWVLNSFEVDIRKLKFADRGASGPIGGINQIRIDIDTANTQQAWCTSIDWASGGFQAMSPIIFIHGNSSNGDFFSRQGFTAELDSRKLAYDNSINLAVNSGGAAFISANANELNNKIPQIVRRLGAKTVHLIVHSKGGLDTREYLANYQTEHQKDFKVISLTTLGTPHNGSVLADVSVERFEAANQVGITGSVLFEGFPEYLRQLNFLSENILGIDDGRRNLTTGFVSSFNQGNLSRLNGLGVTFNTVAADMDLNSNGRIDRMPDDEFLGIRQEGELPDIGASTFLVDTLYQVLRKTRGVNVTYRDECVSVGGINFCRKIATLTSVDNAEPLGNDTLVTIPSGLGAGTIQPLTSNTRTFTGANGKNHSNIADGEVARTVIPWLLEIDRTKGGLR